jgi:SAM-dependent methyltransferase
MQSPPISHTEIDARLRDHVDELLQLWWAEQGAGKPRDLELIARAIPFPRDRAIRVLDLCCGPGDVGRAIRRVYSGAQVDFIDRDPFLTAICAAVNRREGVAGELVVRDLAEPGWCHALPGAYDVVAVVNGLHWFDAAGAAEILKEVHGLLLEGGVVLVAEPVSPLRTFSAGFEEWKATQPPRYTRERWQQFWSRANALLGYDHTALLGAPGATRIGDSLSVAGWIALLDSAGFPSADVLLRDADQVIVGAQKAG